MAVELISQTQNATKVVARAAFICTHPHWPTEYDLHPDRSGPLVRRVIKAGHLSVLEHASYTFAVEGISRAASHQLVRHRIASYSQQSQRYVVLKGDVQEEYYVTPTSIEKSALCAAYSYFMAYAKGLYQDMLDAGIPAEDARFVLPNAATTKLELTMNARELHHFFALRLCNRSQWEIREMARQMLEHCQRVDPVLFENCGPGCLNGPCPEGKRGCGKPWKG